MVEAKTVEPPKKGEDKSVSLTDFMALKNRSIETARRLKEQLQQAKSTITSLESAVKVAEVNGEDDDEVKGVKRLLLDEKKKIDQERTQHEKDLAVFKERERAVRVKELVAEYGIDAQSLSDEEDVEGAALRLYTTRLSEEKRELEVQLAAKETPKVETSPESKTIFETGPVSTTHKEPRDMNTEEFTQFEKDLKRKAGYA